MFAEEKTMNILKIRSILVNWNATLKFCTLEEKSLRNR